MYRTVLDKFYRTPISRVMKKEGYAILADCEPIDAVLEMLIDFGHIWIVDSPISGKLLGVITRKDFMETAMPPQAMERSTPGQAQIKTLYYDAMINAADMMTGPVLSMDEETCVGQALRDMKTNFVRQVPVLRQGRIVGEVSMRDLIQHFISLARETQRPTSGGPEG